MVYSAVVSSFGGVAEPRGLYRENCITRECIHVSFKLGRLSHCIEHAPEFAQLIYSAFTTASSSFFCVSIAFFANGPSS